MCKRFSAGIKGIREYLMRRKIMSRGIERSSRREFSNTRGVKRLSLVKKQPTHGVTLSDSRSDNQLGDSLAFSSIDTLTLPTTDKPVGLSIGVFFLRSSSSSSLEDESETGERRKTSDDRDVHVTLTLRRRIVHENERCRSLRRLTNASR